MKLPLFHGLAAALVLAAATPTVEAQAVGARQAGEWLQTGITQAHPKCLAAYTCSPGKEVSAGADGVVKTTAPESIWGDCNGVPGGAMDSCTSCTAGLPGKRCEFWIEKKK